MFFDSIHAPFFPRKSRPLESFRVSNVERLQTESGEAAVRGVVGGREVEVRFVETSGEFHLVSDDGVEELSRSDLRDFGPALARFQQNVPWVDSLTGEVLKAVNEAIFPTSLTDFAPRSVSDLGPVVLLAGRTAREEIDVVLDTRTSELSIIVTAGARKSARRPLTSQEAWDLAVVLRARVDGQRVTRARSLFALLIEAARRQARH
ncbi:MAG: hypothetical protein ACOZQL_10405 [Myxococcota bacterium]